MEQYLAEKESNSPLQHSFTNSTMYIYDNKTIYYQGEEGSGTKYKFEAQIYEDIKHILWHKKRKFYDVNFPADERSITGDPEAFNNKFNNVKGALSQITWKRLFEVFEKPKFIIDGASRSDINQGELADCWVLVSITNLPLNEKRFAMVVPTDNQDFDDPEYCGIHHFRIWHFGKWIDVVVDDMLPFVKNANGKYCLIFNKSAPRNELWSPLLEKAYAKLKGSYYEAIEAGSSIESHVDLTGGIGYYINLKKYHTNPKLKETLFEMMVKNYKSRAMMSCKPPLAEHVLSITNVVILSPPVIKETTRLIRVRDPHGKVTDEWKGSWCDGCEEWNQLSPAEMEKLGYINAKDGEFWMTYEDFLGYFEKMTFGFLSPNDISEKLDSKRWEMSEIKAKWKKHITAGGSLGISPRTYHKNPQYKITLQKSNESDNCNIVVSLIQLCDRTKPDGCNATNLKKIRFSIYKILDSVTVPLKTEFLKNETNIIKSNYDPFGLENMYANIREQTGWFTLIPGAYMIIPSTLDPHLEGRFLLRVYVDVKYEFKAIKCHKTGCEVSSPKVVYPHEEFRMTSVKQSETQFQFTQLRNRFIPLADSDQEINWIRLKQILDHTYMTYNNFKGFTEDSCRGLIVMVDRDSSGWLGLEELRMVWNFVRKLVRSFKMYEQKSLGLLYADEFASALKFSGFAINNKILKAILYRYGDGNENLISLDQFISCATKYAICIRAFRIKDPYMTGKATFTLQESLNAAIYT